MLLFQERQGEISDDETVQFKSYLLSLGIEDPVTRDAFRSESDYHKNLSRQISTMLIEPIKVILFSIFPLKKILISLEFYEGIYDQLHFRKLVE